MAELAFSYKASRWLPLGRCSVGMGMRGAPARLPQDQAAIDER
jgi:hypothetical protein